jgi:S-formylglutathione hydrolase
MERIEHHACFGGGRTCGSTRIRHAGLRHEASGVYLPPQALAARPLPVLYWLSGLTCTEQNFITKAGAQRYAAEHTG